MNKLTLKRLDIFTPISKDQSISNEEFDINNFLHFPILTHDDGSIWKHGSLYLLSKLKNYQKPSPKTLDSIATDLKHFKEYCDNENIDYLIAPRKVLRPTYLYRSHLQQLLREAKISPNTIKRRMSAVVGFYEYLINIEGIDFKFPLWESGITSISYKDIYGLQHIKQVKTKDVSRVTKKLNNISIDKIEDGGKLRPLSYKEQETLITNLQKINNTEMTLSFLIALTTGARIQTIFTLRKKHFEKELNDCDTKFQKIQNIYIPKWLYYKIKVYLNSPRYQKRKDNAKHIFKNDSEQYIFLTNRGTPYYVANDDPYRADYKEPPNGATVRQFIFQKLKSIDFSFHDLRATYGTNLFDKYMEQVQNKEITLSTALINIKERMSHSSLEITQRYLKYRENNKIKQNVQFEFEKKLERLYFEK
jgi:integrase